MAESFKSITVTVRLTGELAWAVEDYADERLIKPSQAVKEILEHRFLNGRGEFVRKF